MKKRILWIAGICIMSLVLIVGIVRYSKMQKRESDPNWQIAEEIYKVENVLKEVDEDYECQSVSKVTPFTYTDSEGNTIVYYCCQTAYLENESRDYTGLDMNAIGMVIDMTQIKNKQECKVNEYDAFLCEMGDRSIPLLDAFTGDQLRDRIQCRKNSTGRHLPYGGECFFRKSGCIISPVGGLYHTAVLIKFFAPTDEVSYYCETQHRIE